MQRHLILLRHGKASDERSDGDHDRPLSEIGLGDISELHERLLHQGLEPDRVLSSDSRRTLETARRIGCRQDDERCFSLPQLYLAPAAELVDSIRSYGDRAKVLVIIGHNPGIETLIQTIDPRISKVRPGSALVCAVDARLPWHRFSPEAAHALHFLVPGRYSE